MRPDYRITGQRPDAVFIEDLDRGGPSVTNAAETVTRDMAHILDGRRLYYLDTERQWGELRHEAGRFVGFGPMPPDVTPPNG